MPKNRALQRAINCLAHPLSLAAILLLLVNALILQQHSPSWWTGKIGDVAWLFFVPFLAAAALAWFIPPRVPRQETIVGIAAVTLTGLCFALAKVWPALNVQVGLAFRAVTGYPGKLQCDPTDLLAIPSLLGAWGLWRHLPQSRSRNALLRDAALILAVTVMAADATAPQSGGIVCLIEGDGAILAVEEYRESSGAGQARWYVYRSEDGGLTWDEDPTSPRKQPPCQGREVSWPLRDTENGVAYSFVQGKGLYVNKEEDGADPDYVLKGPIYDAILHGPSGNAIFALGASQILVRTPDGQLLLRTPIQHFANLVGKEGEQIIKPTKVPATQTPPPTARPALLGNIVQDDEGEYYVKRYRDSAGYRIPVGVPGEDIPADGGYRTAEFYAIVLEKPYVRAVHAVDAAGKEVYQDQIIVLQVGVYDGVVGQIVPAELILWRAGATVSRAGLMVVDRSNHRIIEERLITTSGAGIISLLEPGIVIKARAAFGVVGDSYQDILRERVTNPFPGVTDEERTFYLSGLLFGLDPGRRLVESAYPLSSKDWADWRNGRASPPAVVGFAYADEQCLIWLFRQE